MTKYFPHLSTSASSFPADAVVSLSIETWSHLVFVHRQISEEEREIYLDYVTLHTATLKLPSFSTKESPNDLFARVSVD